MHSLGLLQTYLQDPEIQKVWNMQNALNALEILWELVEVDQPSLHVLSAMTAQAESQPKVILVDMAVAVP